MIGEALRLGAANFCFWIAGLGVSTALGGRRRSGPLGGPAAAYLVGVATVGTASTLLLVAGVSLARWQVLVLCGVLAACGLPFVRRGDTRPLTTAAWWPALPVAAFLVLLGVDLAFQPLWAYDAWAQWTPKAKAIVLFGGLDAHYLSTTVPNADYPVLVPAVEAVDFRFMGDFGTQVLHLQFWLLVVGYVGALFEVLRSRVRPVALWSLLATLAVAPSLGLQAAYAIADVPLAVFFSLAGLYGFLWLDEGDARAAALLGLFAAAALATKSEGLPFVAALFAVLTVLVFRIAPRRGGITLAVGALSLVGVVPWRVWARSHGLSDTYTGASPQLDHASRIPIAALRLAREALDPTSWLALLPFALAAAALAAWYGSRRGATLLLATVALCYLELVVVYWSTPLPFDYDLDTTARRVVTAPLLFAAALAPLLLESALTTSRRAPTSRPSSD